MSKHSPYVNEIWVCCGKQFDNATIAISIRRHVIAFVCDCLHFHWIQINSSIELHFYHTNKKKSFICSYGFGNSFRLTCTSFHSNVSSFRFLKCNSKSTILGSIVWRRKCILRHISVWINLFERKIDSSICLKIVFVSNLKIGNKYYKR